MTRPTTSLGRELRRVVVSGASGWIAGHLIPSLEADGIEVVRLVRREPAAANEVRWDPAAGVLDSAALEGVDAVVHLAGENIAARRWNEAHKRRVLESRRATTELLAGALAVLREPPEVLVSASAVGYYGDRGDRWLDERAARGTGFLADVCVAWEAAAEPARAAGIRVAHPRIGLVLHPSGGPLAAALPAFRFALGGRFGPGTQYWSWIALDDVVSALRHAILDERIRGPVNLGAPVPVTNAEFTRTLAASLRRPALAPVPAFALRALFGREMADELFLASQRMRPALLEATGFRFASRELEAALGSMFGR